MGEFEIPNFAAQKFGSDFPYATGKINAEITGSLGDGATFWCEHSHQEMDGGHLLLALLGQAGSLLPELLARIGVAKAFLHCGQEDCDGV